MNVIRTFTVKQQKTVGHARFPHKNCNNQAIRLTTAMFRPGLRRYDLQVKTTNSVVNVCCWMAVLVCFRKPAERSFLWRRNSNHAAAWSRVVCRPLNRPHYAPYRYINTRSYSVSTLENIHTSWRTRTNVGALGLSPKSTLNGWVSRSRWRKRGEILLHIDFVSHVFW